MTKVEAQTLNDSITPLLYKLQALWVLEETPERHSHIIEFYIQLLSFGLPLNKVDEVKQENPRKLNTLET